jgi:hypothetical protein
MARRRVPGITVTFPLAIAISFAAGISLSAPTRSKDELIAIRGLSLQTKEASQ